MVRATTENSSQPGATTPALMRSVDRALDLLHHFSLSKPEFGLSELARASSMDKATVLRCLNALERHGFVEQHPETRKYRLGYSLLQLARIRELSFPVTSLLQPVADRLAGDTGETVHVSMMSGSDLVTIAVAEPKRATRVFLDPSEAIPLHATASGLVLMAFARPERLATMLPKRGLVRYTPATPTSQSKLDALLGEVRRQGYALSDQTYEENVTGTAAPIFDLSGEAIGAVSVAALSSRFTPQTADHIRSRVIEAATQITQTLGGSPKPPRPG